MNDSSPPPDRETRLTAYLLGELTSSERLALESELKTDADLQSLLERLRKTVELIGKATPISESQITELPESLRFSPDRREALLETLSGEAAASSPKKTAHAIPWYLPLGMAAGLMLALSYFALIGMSTPGAIGSAEFQIEQLFDQSASPERAQSRARLLAASPELIQKESQPSVTFFGRTETSEETSDSEDFAESIRFGLAANSAPDLEGVQRSFPVAASTGPQSERIVSLDRKPPTTVIDAVESEANFGYAFAGDGEAEPSPSAAPLSQTREPRSRGINPQPTTTLHRYGELAAQKPSDSLVKSKKAEVLLPALAQQSDGAEKLNTPLSVSREAWESSAPRSLDRGRQRAPSSSIVTGILIDDFESLGETDYQIADSAQSRSQSQSRPSIEHGLQPGSAGAMPEGAGFGGRMGGAGGGGMGGGGGMATRGGTVDGFARGFGAYTGGSVTEEALNLSFASPTVDQEGFGIARDESLARTNNKNGRNSGLGVQNLGDQNLGNVALQNQNAPSTSHFYDDLSRVSKGIDPNIPEIQELAAIQVNTSENTRLGRSVRNLADQMAIDRIDAINVPTQNHLERDYYSIATPSGTSREKESSVMADQDKNPSITLGFSEEPTIRQQVARGETNLGITEQLETGFATLPERQRKSSRSNIISLETKAIETEQLAMLQLNAPQSFLSEIEAKQAIESPMDGLATQLSLAKLPAEKAKSLAIRVAGQLIADESQLAPETEERELKERLVKRQKPAISFPLEQETASQSTSTFSLNVSDVSFQLAAASLNQGALPSPETVRPEEFFNALAYHDPINSSDSPVGVQTDRARFPFGFNQEILRIGVRTKSSGRQGTSPLNLVVLLDNSGSMERPDRQAIVRRALESLLSSLNETDKVSILTFARQPRLWTDGLSASEALASLDSLSRLVPEGGTNLEAAIETAYATAKKHFNAKGQNRVILLTDGAANLGNTNTESLRLQVAEQREQGIALDCFGIGWEGYDDHQLESLTRNGDGRYSFLNDLEQVETNFIRQLTGALNVAAKNVKVQITFSPQRVTSYRQIGYGKHQLKKEQFRDNRVDAAELAAEESGTALYVLTLNPDGSGPIGELAIRFQDPESKEFHELNWSLPYAGAAKNLEHARTDTQLAVTAALFAERLAGIPYSQSVSFQDLEKLITRVESKRQLDPAVTKLKNMISQAQRLGGF